MCIVSTEYDGVVRKLYPTNCLVCSSRFFVPKHRLGRKYCSKKCNGIATRTEIELKCTQCLKLFKRKPSALKNATKGFVFCGRTCKEQAQRIGGLKAIQPSHYKDGCDYRAKVEIKFCFGCGDDRVFVLMVHHIDGNRNNNGIENLEVVCPTCHYIRHLKRVGVTWVYDTHVLTPREHLTVLTRKVGYGAAWGGRCTCNADIQKSSILL